MEVYLPRCISRLGNHIQNDVYLRTKSGSSYVKTQKNFFLPGFRHYFQSFEWQSQNTWPYNKLVNVHEPLKQIVQSSHHSIFCTYNMRSLRGKVEEIELFLNERISSIVDL